MFAKLENSILIVAPKKLIGDDTVVYNPPDNMYLSQGWKPLIFTTHDDPPDGYEYEEVWEETADRIVQTWILVQLPDDPTIEDKAEAYDILMGVSE